MSTRLVRGRPRVRLPSVALIDFKLKDTVRGIDGVFRGKRRHALTHRAQASAVRHGVVVQSGRTLPCHGRGAGSIPADAASPPEYILRSSIIGFNLRKMFRHHATVA